MEVEISPCKSNEPLLYLGDLGPSRKLLLKNRNFSFTLFRWKSKSLLASRMGDFSYKNCTLVIWGQVESCCSKVETSALPYVLCAPVVPHLDSPISSFPEMHPPPRFQDPKTRKSTLPEKLAVYTIKLGPQSLRTMVQRKKP